MRNPISRITRPVLFALLATTLSAAQDRPQITVKTEKLADNLYMLHGAGGNLAAFAGPDGVLLIDSEYEQLSEEVIAAVGDLSGQPIRYVVNTHWHFDHVGGNKSLAEAGATIIAHESLRTRMSTEQVLSALERRVPPSPEKALPILTYTNSMTLHLNGDAVRLIHVNPAHTDGDSLVHFPKSNVLHVGDIWFNGVYPFIDVDAGGSIDGMIAAVDRILEIADDNTQIIPGHGPLGDVSGLRNYREMLIGVRANVQKLIDAGKSRDEAIAAKPTAEFDQRWAEGGMPPDIFVRVVYDGMKK